MDDQSLIHISHFPQTKPYGCIFHATAALTQDESWLEHVEDVCAVRWRLRLMEAGMWLHPVYNNEFEPATPEFWERFYRRNSESGFPMFLQVASTPPVRHRVAALVSPAGGKVIVSDSLCSGIEHFSLAAFAHSGYGRCYEADVLCEGRLDDYEPQEPFGESYRRELAWYQDEVHA